jgi:uncharacterized protein (DUF697 family)
MENIAMTDDQKQQCHLIIHTAATASAGIAAGLAQVPLSDSALIVPIQITMIVSLGLVFDVHLTEAAAKGIALGMVGTYVGRAVSQVLLGWIPVLGNALNATTAAGLTEAMGWAVANRFEQGEIKTS